MATDMPSVTIEDAQILFRNFEGREGKFNVKGDRNFVVVLPLDVAQRMAEDGWNVKFKDPRDEGDDSTAQLAVAVSYKYRPPRIVMITSSTRVPLNEDNVDILDGVDIKTVDLVINPHQWEAAGKGGIKAYLKTMFVIVAEDDLERKYAINEVEEA